MRLAVIPARGGSKRIPRKNIKEFRGYPMISWSIASSLRSGYFDEVWVSTDDPEIAEIARQEGAQVPFLRPAHLSDDHTGTTAVIQHATQWASDHAIRPTVIGCIYATAPLLTPDLLGAAGAQFSSQSHLDYLFSGCRFSFPTQRALYCTNEGLVQPVQPEMIKMRSQDLPATFHDAGQFYFGTHQAWNEQRPVFSAQSKLFELPSYLVQDIDTEEDWNRAELLHQILYPEATLW